MLWCFVVVMCCGNNDDNGNEKTTAATAVLVRCVQLVAIISPAQSERAQSTASAQKVAAWPPGRRATRKKHSL